MIQETTPVDMTTPPAGLMSAPKTIDLSLTGRCNLKCEYCFYADSMVCRSDLPSEKWIAFFSEIGDIGVQRVSLSGGELFTRPDLFTLIDSIIENRMRYTILSNGTLITEEVIKAFESGKRRLRLDSIQISIDGSNPSVHDLSRPPHSFERAIRGVRLLKAAHFPVTVRVTLNHHNIHDLEAIAQLLIEDIGLPGFSTNEAEPMGTANCAGQNITLSVQERNEAMKVLMELNERYGGRIGAQAGPLARARSFRETEELLKKGATGRPGRGTLCSCGGVFSKMAVLHDGTMVPCNMLPTLVMGVIGMHALQDAWLKSPAINVIRRRREIPLSLLEECKDCPYTGFCTGGCPASVMAKSGQIIGIDPMSCYREYLKEGTHR